MRYTKYLLRTVYATATLSIFIFGSGCQQTHSPEPTTDQTIKPKQTSKEAYRQPQNLSRALSEPISPIEHKAPPEASSTSLNLSAKEIVKRSDDLMRGETNMGQYSMKITRPQWERELSLYVYSSGRDRVFMRILSPAKEKGIGTLRIENEMWNYLPNVEKIIKIPPSLMLQPWMGSDFANDDLVKESSIVNDYTHAILTEETLKGHTSYKIEFTPHKDAPVIWGKLIRWIRKNDFVPLREEYFNERGKLIKIQEFSDIDQVSDRIIPKTWTMTSATKENHSTTIRLIDVEYNKPINDKIFTLINLKKIQ